LRKLKSEEVGLITHMLNQVPNGDYFIKKLPSLMVTEINNGRMGRLRFLSETSQKRTMQKEVAHINLRDADDMSLSITLNLGTDGELYEFDIFKADFTPLKQFPLPPYNSEGVKSI
jgi:hypothetical protein